MTTDLLTPISIAVATRLRQASIWMSTCFFVALYFIASLIHARPQGARGEGAQEFIDLLLMMSWTTAALGFRPSLPVRHSHADSATGWDSQTSRAISATVAVGVALADGLVVIVGAALIAFLGGMPGRSVGAFGLGMAAAATVGVSASLQWEVVRSFGKRAAVLVVTALATLATLHAAHADLPAPLALLGRLLFPVSALASGTEEPLRLDLAARALSAGVTYDLALIATLLALPGHRARGQT
jgi:hypothetical protein